MTKINISILRLTFAAIVYCSILMSASPADAVLFGAGMKPTEGYQLKFYPFASFANVRTDKNGNKAVDGLDSKRYGVLILNAYQYGDLLLNLGIPLANQEVGKYRSEAGGLGDIQVRVGYFLPIKALDILPALLVKTPTSSYDKKRAANLGDGQTDLAAELYFSKMTDSFSVDLLLKYNHRFTNADNKTKPGNEFNAEIMAAYKLLPGLWIGPAINFMIGDDKEVSDSILPETGQLRLSAGGEIFYGGFANPKLSIAVYQDLITRNSTQGTTIISRITFPF